MFTVEQNSSLPILEKLNGEYEMEPTDIHEETVVKRLKSLEENKSPGPDMVSSKFVKELDEDLCKPITTNSKTSLTSMKIPNGWKKAQVSAIYKKGDRKLASNSRPISLTCILCKCMEGIVRDHIMDYMSRNNLFSNKQYGFS